MENLYIYSRFQEEFGRLLSPMEKEFIDEWKKTMKDDVILQGLKESVYNGVNNSFRYIDKILRTWQSQEPQPASQVPPLDDSWLD